MGASLQRNDQLGHILITSSSGGLGKTTLARIVSNEMLCPLVETSGQCIATTQDLKNILIRLEPHSMLFIDEAHAIGRFPAEELLVVCEEGVINISVPQQSKPVRLELPPITILCATTNPEGLSAPLRQRFPHTLRLEPYTSQELSHIVCGISERMGMVFDNDVCDAIGCRSLGIPRLALRLTESVRDIVQSKGLQRATMAECEFAMAMEGIDHLGLRHEDREVLAVISRSDPRPVSLRSIALTVGSSVSSLRDVTEPVLLRLGLLSVGSGGRSLTAAGREHLEAVRKLLKD